MAAAKKKPDATPMYESWAQVDDACKRIREIDAKVAKAEAKANEYKLKADAELATVADEQTERKQLWKNAEEFCRAHMADMVGKSRKLNHGTPCFRASKECAVKKGFTIQAALNVMMAPLLDAYNKVSEKLAKRYVRLKAEIDKAGALAAYNAKQITDAKLAELGLEIVEKDGFDIKFDDAEAKSTA